VPRLDILPLRAWYLSDWKNKGSRPTKAGANRQSIKLVDFSEGALELFVWAACRPSS
jgi:hypothetical protein